MTPARTPSHPYLAVQSPVAIAHRGGAGQWPQNTMTAFEGAVELGYQYLETDVRATADGELAVFHDPQLYPSTDSVGVIEEMTWSEVSQAKVNGTEPIPRLAEVLDAWPDMRICIDPKSDAAMAPLVKHLRRPGVLERVCMGSFRDARLAMLDKEFGESVCLAMGPKQIARFMQATMQAALLGRLSKPAKPSKPSKSGASKSGAGEPRFRANTIQIPLRRNHIPLVTKRVVRFAHTNNIAVHVWTIDDPAVMHQLLDKEVDGIMTDQPKVLKEVFVERGVWNES